METVEKLATRTTRRRVVSTGAKFAYTAPLVAASFKLSTRGAFAQTVSPAGFCGHSVGINGGCMGACSATCPGHAGSCHQDICDARCPNGTTDRQCDNLGLCDPGNYTCTPTGMGATVDAHYVGP